MFSTICEYIFSSEMNSCLFLEAGKTLHYVITFTYDYTRKIVQSIIYSIIDTY